MKTPGLGQEDLNDLIWHRIPDEDCPLDWKHTAVMQYLELQKHAYGNMDNFIYTSRFHLLQFQIVGLLLSSS